MQAAWRGKRGTGQAGEGDKEEEDGERTENASLGGERDDGVMQRGVVREGRRVGRVVAGKTGEGETSNVLRRDRDAKEEEDTGGGLGVETAGRVSLSREARRGRTFFEAATVADLLVSKSIFSARLNVLFVFNVCSSCKACSYSLSRKRFGSAILSRVAQERSCGGGGSNFFDCFLRHAHQNRYSFPVWVGC